MIKKRPGPDSWIHPLALERRIRILSSVFENQTSSPAHLAKSLGCTRAESSRHVKVLLHKKYLEKVRKTVSPKSTGPGRPGQALRLAPRFACAIAYLSPGGVEIEFLGKRLESLGLEKIVGWKTQGELIRTIRQKVFMKSPFESPLYYCVDGLVMPDLLVSWGGMPDWEPLATSVKKETGEWQTGGALTFAGALVMGHETDSDLFVLHWNRGLKIAHRSKGKLVLGARGTSTPIGHREIRESGRLCRCGRTNCLESLLQNPNREAMDHVVSAVRNHLGKKTRETTLLWSGPWENAGIKKWDGFASTEFPDQRLIQIGVQRGAKRLVAKNLFEWELKREIS